MFYLMCQNPNLQKTWKIVSSFLTQKWLLKGFLENKVLENKVKPLQTL